MRDAVNALPRWASWMLAMLASVSGGCGGAPRVVYGPGALELPGAELAAAEEVRSYRLIDPAHLRFERTRASELFAAALAAHGRGDLDRASTLYDRLSTEFTSSRYREAARYNAALVDVDRGRAVAALARLRRVIAETPTRAAARLAAELLFARVTLSDPLRSEAPPNQRELRVAARPPRPDDAPPGDELRAELPSAPLALRREAPNVK